MVSQQVPGVLLHSCNLVWRITNAKNVQLTYTTVFAVEKSAAKKNIDCATKFQAKATELRKEN
jgi:hypothetical protein